MSGVLESSGNKCVLFIQTTFCKCQALFPRGKNHLTAHTFSSFHSYSIIKNSDFGDIDIVEYEKTKDGKGLPVFNLSIAMDKTPRVSLFYEESSGSVTDVSQFTFVVDKVIGYRYNEIGFVLDSGYFSKANLPYINESDYI